jgi:hypothetical protein
MRILSWLTARGDGNYRSHQDVTFAADPIDFADASEDIGGNGPARTPVEARRSPKFRSTRRASRRSER